MIRNLIALLFICFAVTSMAKHPDNSVEEFTQYTFYLSEVMLHDVVNPPAASRFYAYAMLGAYEVLYAGDTSQVDIAQLFKVYPQFEIPPLPLNYSKSFCAIYAMLDVGKQLIPSGASLVDKQALLINLYRKKYKLSTVDIAANKTFAAAVAAQVINYSKTDGYIKLSSLQRYNPRKGEGYWYPTPPEYMAAVEPQWKTIRPFFLDSAAQFSPAPPVVFNKDKNSVFYRLMQEVYSTGAGLTAEQRAIAAFWDCNPFAVAYSGHMAIGIKKISPGGHWIGITGIACKQASVTLEKAIFAHTMVSLTLYDAFISCWNEKYSSDRLRPETAINKYIDPSWHPLLQTPPFPEYTSGHSVISTASAVILTYIFGENFKYTDTSEEYFGLHARSFNSFNEAANEAAISRLYGGIHFRDAIEAGQVQGRAVGVFVLSKLSR
jgi:hypothetical protein